LGMISLINHVIIYQDISTKNHPKSGDLPGSKPLSCSNVAVHGALAAVDSQLTGTRSVPQGF
jgi:hypothetical protein